MKKMLVCLLTVFTVGLFAQVLHWNPDYGKAQELSRRTGKPMFVFFTGSDWCGWCVRLNQETLSKRDMARYLNDNFVLYKADFPRRHKLPKHIAARNAQLARQYGIKGYPTIMITDGNGRVLGRTGYVKGGPAAMMRVLSPYARRGHAAKPIPPHGPKPPVAKPAQPAPRPQPQPRRSEKDRRDNHYR